MASAISFDKPSFMVDSREREPGALNTIEDFDIKVKLPKNNKFNQVSISTVIIPKSYYNITDRTLGTDNITYSSPGTGTSVTYEPNNFTFTDMSHNQFVLCEGTSSGLITLPLANYNSINFPVVMKDLLESRSSSTSTTGSNVTSGGVFGNNYIYDITYPDPTTEADTRKWTITVSNNAGVQPILYFPTIQPINKPAGAGERNKVEPVRICEIMGMNPEANSITTTPTAWATSTAYSVSDYVSNGGRNYRCISAHTSSASDEPGVGASWNTYWILVAKGQRPFSGNTLTSDFQVDFELTKFIVIKSNISLDQGNDSADNAILGTIPVTNVPDGGIINYELQQLEDESKFLSNNRNNIYSFSLWDDHDEPMNLNGINWFVKLFVYEYNPYFELAINDIRIRQLQLANGSIPSVQREVNQPPPTE